MPQTITLNEPPSTRDLYTRAVGGLLPVIGKSGAVRADAPLPETAYQLDNVRVDPDKLQAYCRTTGTRFGPTLPLTFPFVLQFPLVMKLMVSAEFPFAAVGTVHAENLIRRYRPIGIDEPLTITTHAENLREHRKGLLIDVVSRFTVGSDLVTEQVGTFLKQQRTSLSDEPRPAPPKSATPPPPDAVLGVDLSKIRDYASASGDRNPIHMGNLPAKAFGFPKAIAHGMWSAAAAVANVEHQLPDDVTYKVRFGKPILLPAKLNMYTKRIDGKGNVDLSILHRKKGYPHLTGTTRGN